MRSIFISYRRGDAEGQAGRLFDDLVAKFGKTEVFMDVEDIEPGRDFRKVIDQQISSCGVLLALVGKGWLDAADNEGRRRLDDPNDFVRLETASALKRDIPVIPVLVQGAGMPKAESLPDDLKDFAFRNAVELTHARWESDLQILIKALGRYVETEGQHEGSATGDKEGRVPLEEDITGDKPKTQGSGSGDSSPWREKPWRPILIAVVAAIAIAVFGYQIFDKKGETTEEQRIAQERAEAERLAAERAEEEQRVAIERAVNERLAAEGLNPDNPQNLEKVNVPNVVGLTYAAAELKLRDAGLLIKGKEYRPSDRAPGTVLSQQPGPGTILQRNHQVLLLLAARADEPSGRTPTITPGVILHKRGRLEIPQTYTADLDEGRVSVRNDADIQFEAATSTERYITPRNGASLSLIRSQGLPDHSACASARFSENRFNIEILQRRDMAVCVRTNRGRLAAIKLLEPVGASPGALKIGYLCYER